ncbi:hypothetical protein Aglo01_30900 [Actinokineospora globicatena]|nr:hypothetical protein Aglo01_30900 [Actinokineospora globicatena]GLW84725.1 hypothetical protein Aglo02_23650 [Actinokineospora globicatena]
MRPFRQGDVLPGVPHTLRQLRLTQPSVPPQPPHLGSQHHRGCARLTYTVSRHHPKLAATVIAAPVTDGAR